MDGIFAADEQVFRFYPDGVVLDALVMPPPGQGDGPAIASWLRREPLLNGVYIAEYQLDRGRLSFTTRSHTRDHTVRLEGTWDGTDLILDRDEAGQVQEQLRFARIWHRRPPTAGL